MASAGTVTVSVNGAPVEVRRWARWRDAVTAWDADAGARLSFGEGVVRDGRGELLDPDGRVEPGARIDYAPLGRPA